MQLSENFTLEEMIESQSAVRLGYDEQFSPPDSVKENLKALAVNVLQPIRITLGKPIHISSGYRCLRVNKAIGGAETSQHVKGQAADINADMPVEELYIFIKHSGIVFDQLIQEFGRWVHVSYNPIGHNRQQCLRAIKVDGETKYIPD